MSTITSVKGRTFTVSRAKWLRGEGVHNSFLLRPRDGKMCCLGQIAQQCGYTDEQLLDVRGPHSLKWDEMERSNETSAMMPTNDDTFSNDRVKETRLQEMATRAGFTLLFAP